MTVSKNQHVKSDLRVLERLVEKEEHVHKNIGDAAVIMGLYNADDEEKKIMRSVAKGENPEEAIPDAPVDSSFWICYYPSMKSLSLMKCLKKCPHCLEMKSNTPKKIFQKFVEDDSNVNILISMNQTLHLPGRVQMI